MNKGVAYRIDLRRRAYLSTVSLLLVAAALLLLVVWLVTAPKVGAASDYIVVEPMELAVSEPAGQDVFTITLVIVPTDTVTIALSTSDTTECVVEPLGLQFTPEITQAFATVTAQDDFVIDGPITCTIITDPATSADDDFDGEDPDDVAVIVADNDEAGFILDPTSLTVAEPNGTATFTLALTSQPTATVKIDVGAENNQCAVTPDQLLLTPENWQIGTTATVIAMDDDVIDGPQSCLVETGRAKSDDTNYNTLNPPDVSVIVTDDDGVQDASIGDYVWLDENGDGLQDAAESGIPGVTVFLDMNEDGVFDDGEPSATTNASGIYTITNLTASDYLVRVYTDTVPTGYVLTTNNLPLPVTLAESEIYDLADFGYDDDPEDAFIGDYVWVDQDGDGVQDGAEPGLPDIVVFLDLNDNGTLDDEPSATTDGNGNYAIAGLTAGLYTVTVNADTVPAGYVLTTGNIPFTVDLGVSEGYNDADFGFDDNPDDASIGDYVWVDQDGDGVHDETEPGLPDVLVFLDLDDSGTLDEGEPWAISDTGGFYDITGLAAGFYTVTVDADTVPVGYSLTTGNLPLEVPLEAGQYYDQADFGYDDDPEDASIGDYVWLDENGDGAQDETEPGLSGIMVYLDLDDNGALNGGEPSVTTDEGGNYAITGLAAGLYTVTVNADTVPAGYVLTTGNIPFTVDLGVSEDYKDADFGYDDDPEDASIGDYVWVDQDGDGVQDGAEPGLPDIVVFLDLNDNGVLDGEELFATTNASGNYAIDGLAAGLYTVTVNANTVPAGYVLTTDNIPFTVDLGVSEDYSDADFGYDDVPGDASIGDYVWFDENGDGAQDEAEPGLSGITVYLDLDEDGTHDGEEPSATSDEGGNYTIAGLAAGFYTVTVDADTVPAGYVLTTGDISMTLELVAGEHYVEADFGFEGYTLAVELIGEGSVTVTPDQASYMLDSTVILSPTATVGWSFDSWGGPDESSLSDNGDGTWSLLMDRHKELTATFTEDEYHLTVNVEGMGSVVVDPEWATYRYGDKVTLTATPDAEWRFDSWLGDVGGTTNPAVLEMDGDKTITAVFELQSSAFYVYLPLVLNRWPPVPSVPILASIDNTDGDGSYTVSWSASSGAETYVLQEATNSAFADAAVIYTGPATSYDVSGRGAARYYYRVKARNIWMESDWSNVRRADVLWEAEPNDAYTQANGAIVPKLVYYGTLPNAADVQDYYFFELSAARHVEVWLTNIPSKHDYNLILRDDDLAVVGYAPQPEGTDEHVEVDLPAGRYYIQVHHYPSDGGSTQPYNVWFVLE